MVQPYVDQATVAVKPYVDQATVAVKPYVDQAVASAKPHIEKATVVAKEVHKKHLIPFFAKASKEAQKAAEKAKKHIEVAFDTTVAEYGKVCPETLSSLKAIAKERDITLPASLVSNWTNSCNQPRESVTTALKAFGFLFAFLLRRSLFRLALWLICLPFLPLRLLFGGKKKAKKPTLNSGLANKDSKSTANGKSPNGVHVKKKPLKTGKGNSRISQ